MLARKKAIVSRLESIEELAGIDMLCSDKTGTLTENKLTLGDPQPWPGTDAETLILMGSLASRAADNDPIDLAIMAGLKDAAVLKTYQQEKYVPFDPVNKRTEATVKDAGGKEFRVTKGAPQVVIGAGGAGRRRSGAGLKSRSTISRRTVIARLRLHKGDRRRAVDVSRHLAAVRSAAARFEGDDRPGRRVRRASEDGHRRQRGDRQADFGAARHGHQHSAGHGAVSRRRDEGPDSAGRGRARSRGPTASPRCFPSTSLRS